MLKKIWWWWKWKGKKKKQKTKGIERKSRCWFALTRHVYRAFCCVNKMPIELIWIYSMQGDFLASLQRSLYIIMLILFLSQLITSSNRMLNFFFALSLSVCATLTSSLLAHFYLHAFCLGLKICSRGKKIVFSDHLFFCVLVIWPTKKLCVDVVLRWIHLEAEKRKKLNLLEIKWNYTCSVEIL